jgi:diguanylate cyclase (GGDEF)-like protein
LFLFLLFAIVCILGLVGFFIRKVVQENIEKKASHDQLTNLLNRNYLHQIYNVKLSDSLKKSSFLAVLMCDIDHFKYVNDTFGHDVGDKVLKRIAEIK